MSISWLWGCLMQGGSNSFPTARQLCDEDPTRFAATGDWEPPPGDFDLIFLPSAVTAMGASAEIVAKKAALYGSHTYMITPYEASMYFYSSIEHPMDTPDMIYGFSQEFTDFLDRLMPFYRDGCIRVFPTWTTNGGGTCSYPINVRYPGLLKVELKEKYILDQMTEAPKAPKAVSLFLPHIASIPPAHLIDVRHEYQDSLTELRRSLYGLVSSSEETGDRVLYEVMQEVDHRIRELNDRMKRLEGKVWFERMKLGLVGFPMILTLVVPPEFQDVVRAATAMIGSASALSFIEGK